MVITAAAQSFAGLPEFARVRKLATDRQVAARQEADAARAAQLEALATRAEEADRAQREELLREQVNLLEQQVGEERERADAAEADLTAFVEEFDREKALLVKENEDLRAQISEMETERSAEHEAAQLETAAREFREEMAQVYASWPPDNQQRFPMGPVRFHEEFFASVVAVAREKRRQTVEKCTFLACNWLDAVETKEARPPEGGEHRRGDGAVAMRADLEQNTPAARRIQYWRLTDGQGLEFVRVANHDDFATPENARVIV
jgi:regulator of replication initiation timing